MYTCICICICIYVYIDNINTLQPKCICIYVYINNINALQPKQARIVSAQPGFAGKDLQQHSDRLGTVSQHTFHFPICSLHRLRAEGGWCSTNLNPEIGPRPGPPTTDATWQRVSEKRLDLGSQSVVPENCNDPHVDLQRRRVRASILGKITTTSRTNIGTQSGAKPMSNLGRAGLEKLPPILPSGSYQVLLGPS